jgi:hypothetical protein
MNQLTKETRRDWRSCATRAKRGGRSDADYRARADLRMEQWTDWKARQLGVSAGQVAVPEHAQPVGNADKWHAEHQRQNGGLLDLAA